MGKPTGAQTAKAAGKALPAKAAAKAQPDTVAMLKAAVAGAQPAKAAGKGAGKGQPEKTAQAPATDTGAVETQLVFHKKHPTDGSAPAVEALNTGGSAPSRSEEGSALVENGAEESVEGSEPDAIFIPEDFRDPFGNMEFALDEGTVKLTPEGEAVVIGKCATCHVEVFEGTDYCHWQRGAKTYYQHKECKKMSNCMTYVITRKSPELKDIWEAQPIDKRLAWYRRHPGMGSDQLATCLKATYSEILKVSAKRKFCYTGIPSDKVTLEKKYLPDRQEQFDRIIANGGWQCPMSGAMLYEDPSYEFSREHEENRNKTRSREAEQDSVVKAAKKKKGRKGAGAKPDKTFSRAEVDGAAEGEAEAEPKAPKPKKLSPKFLQRAKKLLESCHKTEGLAKEEVAKCAALGSAMDEELLEDLKEGMEALALVTQEIELAGQEEVTDGAKPNEKYKSWAETHEELQTKMQVCVSCREAKSRRAAKRARCI